MKTFFATLVILFFASSLLHCNEKRFEEDMAAALHIHDTTKSVSGEIIALQRFKEVCKKYPEEWLPNYWTAYLLTQVARLKGRADDFPKDMDPGQLIRDSQQYFDRANQLLANKNDGQTSDFHVLQGFIYGWFSTIVADSEGEKERYSDLQKEHYRLAAIANHNNPIIYVLIGINLTNDQEDYRRVLAGIAMLNYADEIFSRKPQRSLTTYWNKDFIPFWRSRAEKKLKKMLGSNENS